MQGQEIGGVDFGDHVGELEGNALIGADRLAELLALGGVGHAVIEDAPRPADAIGGHRQAGAVEPVIGRSKPLVHLAEDLRRGQAASSSKLRMQFL